jgi:Skp family chaperone for outer membrane proteins
MFSRRALSVAFLITLIVNQLSSLSAAELKAGMVDYQKIQRHYYRIDLERKAVEERRDQEIQKLEESLSVAREKVEALLQEQQNAQEQLKDPTLSEDKKREVLAAAQQRAGEITTLQRQSAEQQNLSRNLVLQRAEEANAAILKEINEAIRIIAEQKGVDFVMNRDFGVRGIPTFPHISAMNILDLTEDVIGKLNQNAPAGWAPTPSAPK